MKRVFRWTLTGTAVVAGLLAICLALVRLLFDPNDYRLELQNQFQQRTGRELRIAGDLKLSIWPWLAVRSRTVTVGNAPGFGEQYFFSVDEARIGVRLLPLLSRRFEIGKVSLRHPRLHLVVDRDGSDNWSDLLAARANDAEPSVETDASSAASGFSVAGVELIDGTFEYEDRRNGTRRLITNIAVDVGRLEPGRPFSLELSFVPASLSPAEIRLQVGKAMLDMTQRRLELPGWKLIAGDNRVAGDLVARFGEQGAAVDGSARASKLLVNGIELRDVDAQFDLKRQKLRLRPLKLSAFGGESVTTLTYDMGPVVPVIQVDQRLTDVDTGALLGALIDVDELQGRGTLRATLAGRGSSRDAIVASLQGPFSLSVRDGELRGADLWYEIQRAAAVLERRPPPAAPKSPRTIFHRLEARGRVERSTLRNDRFDFATGFLTVRGKGDVNYGRGQVDLALKARLLRAPKTGSGSASLAPLVGVDIPVTVTGPLRDPAVQPDVARVLQTLAQDRLQQESEKAGRKLKDKVRSALDRLFN